MSEEKNIVYSATDIERYHKGLMTAKERHALEKAALDDPFLADAIEGYAAVPTNADADIALLNKRLDERIGKVVPLKRSGFVWLRVAAVFILVAGASLLAYNYLFQNKKNEVAAITKKDTITNKSTSSDTIKAPAAEPKAQELNLKEKQDVAKNDAAEKKGRASSLKKEMSNKKKTEKGYVAAAPEKLSDISISKDDKLSETKADSFKTFINTDSQVATAKPQVQNNARMFKNKNEQPQYKYNAKSLNESAVARGVAAQNNQTHIFRGQVTDQYNSPLPFANVTIVPDNIGTYTDAKGNFTLISSDSTLNVQVRSVGFENKSTQLQTVLSNNSIVLDQDTKNIPATVISNRSLNSERKRMDNNMKLEEPEPADGWYNYDTYIANNINISDEIKMKTNPSSEVELSFEVNEYGEPVNIKVEKSVCKECDAEAIRLLKEGPKWKKNKKNKRAKVAVAFQ